MNFKFEMRELRWELKRGNGIGIKIEYEYEYENDSIWKHSSIIAYLNISKAKQVLR